MIQYKCAKCGAGLESPSPMAGQEDVCPLCGARCIVPKNWNRLLVTLGVCGGGAALVLVAVIALWPGPRGSPVGPGAEEKPVSAPAVVNGSEQGKSGPASAESTSGGPVTRPATGGPAGTQAGEEHPRAFMKLRFKCRQCGHEFEMNRVEYAEWAAKVRPAFEDLGKASCPKCEGKFTCARMAQCHICRKYFPPEQVKQVETPEAIEWHCPLCGGLLNKAPLKSAR